MNEYSELIIITNIFGHVQNLEEIKSNFYNLNSKIILFDNAATPYSFIDGVNSCCLCDGSSISLHHTKPLGFGEGGLMIVKKEMEADAREVINFGKVEGQFNERGGNYKMSDISAAAILQYWDSFDIDELASTYKNNYFKLSYDLATKYNGQAMPNFSDEEGFFPANLPFVFPSSTSEGNFKQTVDAKKYYKPLTAHPMYIRIYKRTTRLDRVVNMAFGSKIKYYITLWNPSQFFYLLFNVNKIIIFRQYINNCFITYIVSLIYTINFPTFIY